MDPKAAEKPIDGRLPLTLISGFLGAGKTTLLKHILRNKKNMRVCVIVNDMAALNIDASLIKNTKLVQTEERLVEMQNGCICCTLRDDLIQEVGALARSGKFDYLVVESTGIGEPMQVAETFTMELEDEHGVAALHEVARLDTCVTVVDAANLLANAESVESLADRGEAADDEDDRNVADLLLDQIEFADIIVLNKVDLVDKEERRRLLTLLHMLNPSAEIRSAINSEVDMGQLINTGKFSFEKAAQSAGWLKSLQLQNEGNLVPETEEYGIGSFVYRSRRPFHAGRLHEFMTRHFLLQEPDWKEAMEEESKEGEHACGTDNLNDNNAVKEDLQKLDLNSSEHVHKNSTPPAAATAPPVCPQEAAVRRERLHSSFGQVLRSKGFVWLASRSELCGEWSQAGGILRFTVGGPWYATLPEEAWPKDPQQRADVEKDFEGPHGDRRQELVFIGIDVNKKALQAELDRCLVADGEEHENVADTAQHSSDPFAQWPSLEQILDAGGEEDEVEGEEEDESFDDVVIVPGEALEVLDGAAEMQEALNCLEPGSLVVVHWLGRWIPQSIQGAVALRRAAAAYPGLAAIHLDVEGSYANKALAMEKVLEKPSARREGAKPVLRSAARWPCFTVHYAPNLQPARMLTGDGALAELEQVAAEAGLGSTEGVRLLENGAAEFKAILTEGKAKDQPVVVIWSSPSYAKHSLVHVVAAKAAGRARHAAVVFADVAGSRSNTVLAGALGIKELPAVHVYRNMKLETKIFGEDATSAAILAAASGQHSSTIPVQPSSSPTPGGDAAQRARSEFDPPTGKYARAGAGKRMLDGRNGFFFPKMPCLRCGCPWWTSEEWNARCVRCGWDCESGGYDDDSKPLNTHLKKWEAFTAAIKEGRTPEWRPTRGR